MTDQMLFVAIPYAAVLMAVVMTVYRYRNNRFSYSSLSSQLLENNVLSWASVAWHYAILLILIAHVSAAVFPGAWAALQGGQFRLYVIEITGMGLALMAIIGMVLFIWRRLVNPRVRVVTSPGDWVLLVALLAQVVLGFVTAFAYRWGGLWYLHTATPWLESLVRLDPDTSTVAMLPWLVKLHFVGGFLMIALVPFTRLIHALVIPIEYLWRPYRIVVWNRRQALRK
ncbi:respiratory nitrate reductase subunit gamma [Aggregatilinea lenta]|uniref:respiratory nitrate reductase subunit gamma n=1 Tax=Aggregatilinea lenta TaxID=913108 RepID=UPI000E5BB42E|nr:respiratory nitrate reductase subunit gamma [Aggregatilinea lenta]